MVGWPVLPPTCLLKVVLGTPAIGQQGIMNKIRHDLIVFVCVCVCVQFLFVFVLCHCGRVCPSVCPRHVTSSCRHVTVM